MSLVLVKETQKDWRCNFCQTVIEKGSSMIRKPSHWATKQFCLECAQPIVNDEYNIAIECFKIFDNDDYKSDDPNSIYQSYKQGILYYENIKKLIKKVDTNEKSRFERKNLRGRK